MHDKFCIIANNFKSLLIHFLDMLSNHANMRVIHSGYNVLYIILRILLQPLTIVSGWSELLKFPFKLIL